MPVKWCATGSWAVRTVPYQTAEITSLSSPSELVLGAHLQKRYLVHGTLTKRQFTMRFSASCPSVQQNPGSTGSGNQENLCSSPAMMTSSALCVLGCHVSKAGKQKQGGLGNCMDRVVVPPCWPVASVDPDKESQTPVSGCQLGRNHEKTATLQVKKEAVYIFSGMNESIQTVLFILVNLLWKLRNFHERVIFNVSSHPSESEESGMPMGPL
ncbi:uncharacterized protein LOC135184461 [Pogoniulus pusillus]|uniref:uncharacterized protein LOC135184461 n=1 Tax=Pogoniulus pusillus TaxID=488313 RepID=UPI0030B969ED